MRVLAWDTLQSYRQRTYCSLPELRLTSRQQAIDFVNRRGFIFFWPIQGVTLPSLWVAVAGERPVPSEHDDPGHITWEWKDSLLGSRAWYYAKVLRKKATFISMSVLPYFYALSENYGSPEDDHLTLYEQGRLTLEAKTVYEAVLKNGPLDTIALRRAARLSSPDSEGRFNKALADLQAAFMLAPVAVAQAGAWHYAFVYEIVARHYPEIPQQARFIGERDARRKLVELYFRSVGAAQLRDVILLFGWEPSIAERTVQSLIEAGTLCADVHIPDHPGMWIALSELMAFSSSFTT
jgi:hypothetical protein